MTDENDMFDTDDLDAAFGPENAIPSGGGGNDDYSADDDIRGDDQVGPAPATDVQRAEYTEPPTRDASPVEMETEWGSHPWGAGGSYGYRPMSMAMTDRSMGDIEKTKAGGKYRPTTQQQYSRAGNNGVDPMTLYDRDALSWNYGGDMTGQGIFDMEESGENLPGYGIFGNQYAMPGYLSREPIMDVEQSEMWDIEAGDWRTVQPSASGVPLSRRTGTFSPFSRGKAAPWTQLRPVPSGPQSHIESYGRGTAQILMHAAKRIPNVQQRSAFVDSALAALGPRAKATAQATVQKLTQMGYPPEKALEDTVAHLIMNATAREMKWGSHLPHLDALVKRTGAWGTQITSHARDTIGPLVNSSEQKKQDLGRLYNSPAGQAMGRLGEDAPAESTSGGTKIFTPKNLLIGGAVAVGGYFLWKKFGKKRKGATT